MNKFLLSILMGSILSSNLHAQDVATTLSTHLKAGAHHLFSPDGVKDVAAAYSVTMLITLIHEMGHAVVAKLVCGAPVDVVIGGPRREGSRLKFAGVECAGFNPLESNTRWKEHHEADGKICHPWLGQSIAVSLAGPLAQAITSGCIFNWLMKNTDKFYLAKLTALGGLVDTVIGINGMYGALYLPWTDSAKIVKNIKHYFQSKSAHRDASLS